MRRILSGLLALLLVALLVGAGVLPDRTRVLDPYAGGKGRWFRGQLHCHSTVHRAGHWCHPDSLRDKVERYRDAGFDFVCVSDHNFVGPSPGVPYAALPTRDPRVPGIHFISGAEITFVQPESAVGEVSVVRAPHLGGVGMDWTSSRGDSLFRLSSTDVSTFQAVVDSIRTMRYAPGKEALAILNHPEMVSTLSDGRLFPTDFDGLRDASGIEVYNTFWARSRPGGRSWQHFGTSHWDFLLLHGEGTRWGFATDDAHAYVPGYDYLGGWVLVQAESLATEPLLDAIRAGRFVACVDSCKGAARDTASAVFAELGVRGRSIVAASDRPTEFTWWTDGGHVARRSERVRRDTYRVQGWERSVRVRIRNAAGAAYSQPFFVEAADRDEDRWRLRSEPATRLLLHFDEGVGPVAHDASGQGHPLLLTVAPPPPASEWRTLADTTAYRDAPWCGWLLHGVGTTPDETELDRDPEGYAIVCHDRSLRGEIPVLPGSSLLVDGAMTIEWIGRVTARTELEQPLIVNEARGADGKRSGWRVAAAEAGAADAFRFRFGVHGGESDLCEVSFGRDLDVDDVHLYAVVLEDDRGSVRVKVAVDGRIHVDRKFPDRSVAWRIDAPEAPPLAVFDDPSGDPSPVYAYFREIRLSAAARSDAKIRDDARRLGYSR